MIDQGKIEDAKTVVGFFKWRRARRTSTAR